MSVSSGRYQSKLLNFLSGQFRWLGETSSSAVRHLKVATVWGAQMLVYPIYALFQTVLLAGRQLQPSGDKGRQLLQESTSSAYPESPISDTPLDRVLSAVKALSLSGAFVKQVSPLSLEVTEAIAIRGVASGRKTRKLVLVSDRNQILDLLPQQQQKLQQQIVKEVADYCNATLPPPLDATDNFLPPIILRPFLAIMTWMQNSSVAIAINLFQKAAIAPTGGAARLVSDSPGTSLIQGLIRAAIDFFFASYGDKLPGRIYAEISPARISLHHLAASRNYAEANPTLTQGEWSGTFKTLPSPSHAASFNRIPHPTLGYSQDLRTVTKETGFLYLDRLLKRQIIVKKPGFCVSPNSQSNQNCDNPQKTPNIQTVPTQTGPTATNQGDRHNHSANNTPDWIETEAYVMGYVKNPLEVLLEWLDRALLWLEELIVKVLRFLQQQTTK